MSAHAMTSSKVWLTPATPGPAAAAAVSAAERRFVGTQRQPSCLRIQSMACPLSHVVLPATPQRAASMDSSTRRELKESDVGCWCVCLLQLLMLRFCRS